jgi:hypothetical protein
VGAVQLDGIEAEPHGPLRCLHERRGDALHALGIERLRRRPVRIEGDRRWRDGRPGILRRRQRLATLPRPLRGRLAAGVADLDRKARPRRRHPPRRIEHAGERRLVGVGVEAEAAVRDAPVPLHRRRLQHDHAGARDGELHQVLQVPVGGAAVGGRVLAHGRHDDAVGNLDWADGKRREEVGHGRNLVVGKLKGRAANGYAIRNRPSTATLPSFRTSRRS